MSRGLLKQIDSDAARIWGTELVWQFGVPIDVEDATYTRENIHCWLIRWHEFGQMASVSFKWAQAIADVELAVSKLPTTLRNVFEYHYVLGYSPDEVIAIMKWKRGTSFDDAIGRIERFIHAKLSDRRIYKREYSGIAKPIPDLQDFPTPIGPKNTAM